MTATVSLSQREPQVGSALSASVDDDDGDITNVEWQWYRLTQLDATKHDPRPEPTSLPTTDCVAEPTQSVLTVVSLMGYVSQLHANFR